MSFDLDPADWILNYDASKHDGNRVTHMIDGAGYFAELDAALASLAQDDFFYATGWAINSQVTLSAAGPPAPKLHDRVATALANQATIRFLLYKGMPTVTFNNWWHDQLDNRTHLQFIQEMTALGAEAIIDRNHPMPAGSHHGKYVIVGKKDISTDEYTLTGYVGGIDLDWGRWATEDHDDPYTWHDVQYKIEGPIVYDLLLDFEHRWGSHPSEIVTVDGSPTKTPTSLALASAFTINQSSVDTAIVQPLFTYPCAPENLEDGRTQLEYETDAYYAFVPRGQRTIEEAIFNAIRQAEVYIYLENYAFYHHGIAEEIAARLEINPALQVIYLGDYLTHHLYQPDTSDAFDTITDTQYGYNFKTYDLRHPNKLYAPVDLDYPDENYPGRIYPHSKVMIVDDRWATVGSANFNHRSMTTDNEVNIGFVDNQTLLDTELNMRVSANVRAFRQALWAEHLQTTAGLEHMATALDTWDTLAHDVPHVPSIDPNASLARVFRQNLALRNWRYYSSPGSYWPAWDWYIDPKTAHPESL